MIRYLAISLLTVLLVACNSTKKQDSFDTIEDTKAKEMLQGIWLDDETESPLIKIKGDSIYYTDAQSTPIYFKIANDTLYTYGNKVTHYKIDQQTAYSFWFHSLSDNIVKLHKSEDINDSLAFSIQAIEATSIYTEITKKDSIVTYNGTRYRAYAYINPSKIKVTKTTYSEEGIGMDNVYYDNVMHICVYEGKKCLYNSDITKQMFGNIMSEDFLQQSILSDIEFKGVSKKGFHYQATICIPESSACNIANLIVDFDGELIISL